MDYKAFYNDIVEWIQQVNQAASKYGMASEQFWQWVADSCGVIERKYHRNRLVIKQLVMLVEWLEEVYENQKDNKE
jgi:ABC-type transporter Mla subunit MlaD